MQALLRAVVHASDRAVKAHTVLGRGLGPDKGRKAGCRARGTQEAKEGGLLEAALLVLADLDMIDHRVDVGVKQGVHRKRRGLHLRGRKGVELACGAGINNGDLDAVRVLVGLLHRKLRRELRKAAAPFHAHVERRHNRANAGVLGKSRGGHAANIAPANLDEHDRHQKDRDKQDCRARDALVGVGTRGVSARQGVIHRRARRSPCTTLALGNLFFGVPRLVDTREELLGLVARKRAARGAGDFDALGHALSFSGRHTGSPFNWVG